MKLLALHHPINDLFDCSMSEMWLAVCRSKLASCPHADLLLFPLRFLRAIQLNQGTLLPNRRTPHTHTNTHHARMHTNTRAGRKGTGGAMEAGEHIGGSVDRQAHCHTASQAKQNERGNWLNLVNNLIQELLICRTVPFGAPSWLKFRIT